MPLAFDVCFSNTLAFFVVMASLAWALTGMWLLMLGFLLMISTDPLLFPVYLQT
jgi:hypothetical protein